MALSIVFRDSISLLSAIQATRLLTFTSVGLSPTERASLSWSHNRMCGFPASGSRRKPREIARPLGNADETQHIVQGCLRKPRGPRPQLFVLGTQPLTQPLASALFHRSIGLADWTRVASNQPPALSIQQL